MSNTTKFGLCAFKVKHIDDVKRKLFENIDKFLNIEGKLIITPINEYYFVSFAYVRQHESQNEEDEIPA